MEINTIHFLSTINVISINLRNMFSSIQIDRHFRIKVLFIIKSVPMQKFVIIIALDISNKQVKR